MPVHPRKLEKLKKRLQHVLKQESLQAHRSIVQQLNGEMAISPTDFAAALLFINQPHLFQNKQEPEESHAALVPLKIPAYRNVRYRLDVGISHQITEEQVLAVLIEESGVDRKRIARMDMRDTYTLVDLPDGMPADIFQLLSEAMVEGRRLNIKRVKPNRRKFRDVKRAND